MAHPVSMGPPLSPKEPRRSGRRAAPSGSNSTSKSPDSPASESAPRPSQSNQRPALSSTNNSGRNKRSKQEEFDDAADDLHKNGTNGAALANGSSRNNKRKTKEKIVTEVTIEAVVSKLEPSVGDAVVDNIEPEEQEGITRCVCGSTGEDEADAGEFMVQCETCDVWQHGLCMGYEAEDQLPKGEYHCEQCRPDMHVELLKKLARRVRHPSSGLHHSSSGATRASRSHSPSHLLKPAKRRNTMNSRDAAYDESLKEIMEATAAEAAAVNKAPSSVSGSVVGHGDIGEQNETEQNGRKKRKRTDDDPVSAKRTRSVSTTSERPAPSDMNREETPVSAVAAKAMTMPAPPVPTKSRNRRGGGRKSAVRAQDLASVDGDEAATPNKRVSNSRSKGTSSAPAKRGQAHGSSNHEHGTRRNYSGGANGSSSHAPGSAVSRAYRDSHAYVVSQQSLLTSWNLPDYLAHLAHILPTDAPEPLEVRMSGSDPAERSTERGVKVKWPSKRMSVGDMNKRIRSLVEWVVREQANTLERGRRREALEGALKEAAERPRSIADGESGPGHGRGSGGDQLPMILDGDHIARSPTLEKQPGAVSASENELAQQSTMKMMEELMEELIGFQERFGPGAKSKERERRAAAS